MLVKKSLGVWLLLGFGLVVLVACAHPEPKPTPLPMPLPMPQALPSVPLNKPAGVEPLRADLSMWVDRIAHQPLAWAEYPNTFTLRLENLKASHVLALLAQELKLGYDMDRCGDNTLSLVGHNMPLASVVQSLEQQTQAQLRLQGGQLRLRCEEDELRIYKLDYLAIRRGMKDSSSLSSAVSGAPRDLLERRENGNRSELLLSNDQEHEVWQHITSQIEQLVQVQIKPTEIVVSERISDEDRDRQFENARNPTLTRNAPVRRSASQVSATRRDTVSRRSETRSGKVVANPESGTVAVLAKPSQQRRVQDWLSQVQRRLDKQIVIEAMIAEVLLNDRYERGIDWNVLRQKSSTVGLLVQGLNVQNPAFAFNVGRDGTTADANVVLRLLEEFGQTQVLSSPRVVTMNQQPAVLKVIDNRVYFTTEVQTSAPTQNSPAFSTFNTQVQTVPVGFLMTVTPAISDANAIQLRVRPTLSRIVGFVADPNPALRQLNIVSQVPEIQTRELESILRLKNGEMALLGGLRQQDGSRSSRGIPGVPDAGDWLTGSVRRTGQDVELVILLKATVLDARGLSEHQPTLEHPGNLQGLQEALGHSLVLAQAGQWPAVQRLLSLLRQEYPRAPEPHYNLSLLYARQGKIQEAQAALQEASTRCLGLRCELPLLTIRALIGGDQP
jgi:MSHA biogenesis protein MshL